MAMKSLIQWLRDHYLGITGMTWNTWWGCERVSPACLNCLDPDTLVLYADMTWRPIGDAKVGDQLVAFTDEPHVGQNRVFETATIEAIRHTRQSTVEFTAGGRTVVASAGHRWLTNQARPYWRTTESLTLGDRIRVVGAPQERPDLDGEDYRAGYIAGATAGDGTMRWDPAWRSASLGFPQRYWRVAVLADDRAILDRLADYLIGFGIDVKVKSFDGGPTSQRQMLKVETRKAANLEAIAGLLQERTTPDWMAGWLAGLLDTDGSFSRTHTNTWLRISQSHSNRHVIATAEHYAAALGIPFKYQEYGGKPGLRLTGRVDTAIAFLTRVAPALERKCQAFYGQRLFGPTAEVTAVRRGPVRDLVDIQTSTGTFVAEGLATHNCYIFRQPPLRMRHLKFDKAAVGGKTEIVYAPRTALFAPLRHRKPLLVFSESLGDLWHGKVHIDRTADMYAVMLLCPQHIFITLTKRSRRMRNWLRSPRFRTKVLEALGRIIRDARDLGVKIRQADIDSAYDHLHRSQDGEAMLPPPNVWVGVTVEDNHYAAERIPDLAATPAAVRVISCEPLTSELDDPLDDPLDLAPWLEAAAEAGGPIDWAIFGGESGPAAKATELDTEPAVGLRPISLPNLERLIGQARTAGARVFVKQLGEPWAKENGAVSRSGGNPAEWPAQLRIREYPLQLAQRALTFDPRNVEAFDDLYDAGLITLNRQQQIEETRA
jgi:protein gp37